MNENVRMPIQTVREGNKITKTCVEDIYKIVNRVQEAMDKAYNNSVDILDSVHKEVLNSADNQVWEGEFIIGTGISQPCLTDAFDEEIGNNIAFMKMKLNVNIKKRNILNRIFNQYLVLLNTIDAEMEKIDEYVVMDVLGIRKHNPDYLSNYITITPDEDEIQEKN